MSPDALAAWTATRQHSLLTRQQAFDAGLTRRQVGVRLQLGRWELERPGVYAIAGGPLSERRSLLAVQLSTGAMGGYLTAGRLWGLDLPPPDEIEVVGPRTRLDGVRSHQSGTLVEADIARLGAIRLTSPARTLVDCAKRVPPHRLGLVVDDALRRRLVTLSALRAVHERIDTGPGRRPTVAMREVLAERAGTYQPGDSVPEPELLRALTVRGLPAPVLGHRVRIGRRNYRIDISWPEWKVGLEWDSWEFHRWYSSFHADRQRLRRLVAAGWTMMPVTSKTDFGELADDVGTVIWQRSTG